MMEENKVTNSNVTDKKVHKIQKTDLRIGNNLMYYIGEEH